MLGKSLRFFLDRFSKSFFLQIDFDKRRRRRRRASLQMFRGEEEEEEEEEIILCAFRRLLRGCYR
jgi:hypothetical protein